MMTMDIIKEIMSRLSINNLNPNSEIPIRDIYNNNKKEFKWLDCTTKQLSDAISSIKDSNFNKTLACMSIVSFCRFMIENEKESLKDTYIELFGDLCDFSNVKFFDYYLTNEEEKRISESAKWYGHRILDYCPLYIIPKLLSYSYSKYRLERFHYDSRFSHGSSGTFTYFDREQLEEYWEIIETNYVDGINIRNGHVPKYIHVSYKDKKVVEELKRCGMIDLDNIVIEHVQDIMYTLNNDLMRQINAYHGKSSYFMKVDNYPNKELLLRIPLYIKDFLKMFIKYNGIHTRDFEELVQKWMNSEEFLTNKEFVEDYEKAIEGNRRSSY